MNVAVRLLEGSWVVRRSRMADLLDQLRLYLASKNPWQSRSRELLMFRRACCYWSRAFDRDIGSAYSLNPLGKYLPLRQYDLAIDPLPLHGLHGAIACTPTFVLMEAGREAARLEGYPGDSAFWSVMNIWNCRQYASSNQMRLAPHSCHPPNEALR